MADLSFSFHWSQASSAMVIAAAASDVASSAMVMAASASNVASAASVAAAGVSAAAAAASSMAAIAVSSAAGASSAVALLDTTVIKSVPGAESRAVHEIIVTSAGLIKYVYSSVAQA